MIEFNDLVSIWTNFFFDPNYSSCSIGCFRIVWGILCCIKFCLYLSKTPLYLGVDGFHNIEHYLACKTTKNKFCILKYLPYTNNSVYLILYAGIVFSIMLSIGLWSRLSAFMVYVLLVSVTHRNIFICSSGDAILRIYTFLLIFSRLGDCFSVDNYINGLSLTDGCGAPWIQRLMQIQTSIIYLYSSMTKLNNSDMWKKGIASYYVMNNKSVTVDLLPKWLIAQPFVQLSTYGTLIVELMLSLLIWIKECKPWCIASGFCLHLSLELCIRIELFGYIMMSLLVLFFEAEWIIRLWDRLF